MRFGNWFLTLAATALLASVTIPRYTAEAWRPDLFAIMAIFVALRGGTEEVLPLCWVTGLVKDLLSAGPLGQYALLYLLAGMAILHLRSFLNARMAAVHAGLAFSIAFLTESISAWAGAAFGLWSPSGTLRGILTAAIVTACLAPLVIGTLDRMGKWLGVRRARTWRLETRD